MLFVISPDIYLLFSLKNFAKLYWSFTVKKVFQMLIEAEKFV